MGIAFNAFLLIDDNTPGDTAPFTSAPSIWDLRHDIGLAEGKHYEFYTALGGDTRGSGLRPLYPLRGFPKEYLDRRTLDAITDMPIVGWLTLSEIDLALKHVKVDLSQLDDSVLLLLDVMRAVEARYGRNRVRLLFGIE